MCLYVRTKQRTPLTCYAKSISVQATSAVFRAVRVSPKKKKHLCLSRAVSQSLTISPQTSLHHVSERMLTRPANRARKLQTWMSERVPQRKLDETHVPLFFRPGNAAKTSSSSEALAARRVFLLLLWPDVNVSGLYNAPKGGISISRLFAGRVFKDLPR